MPLSSLREEIFNYVQSKYGSDIEYLWRRYPDYAIFRHNDNLKCDMSYEETASKAIKQAIRPPKEWIIPSNSKYYDSVHAFDKVEEINWKQGKGIKKGDTVFMYIGAPVSAVLYKCVVTETDIPYHFQRKELTITSLMRIKLLKKYDPEEFTFDRLKNEFDIFVVRGPRGIPDSLSKALNA